jgi:hypothetical protein
MSKEIMLVTMGTLQLMIQAHFISIGAFGACSVDFLYNFSMDELNITFAEIVNKVIKEND